MAENHPDSRLGSTWEACGSPFIALGSDWGKDNNRPKAMVTALRTGLASGLRFCSRPSPRFALWRRLRCWLSVTGGDGRLHGACRNGGSRQAHGRSRHEASRRSFFSGGDHQPTCCGLFCLSALAAMAAPSSLPCPLRALPGAQSSLLQSRTRAPRPASDFPPRPSERVQRVGPRRASSTTDEG